MATSIAQRAGHPQRSTASRPAGTAVLLGLPPGAVLGGLSAARYDRLEGFPEDALTVVAPASSRRPHPWPDVRLHWSTELSALEVHPHRDPPRTRIARSLVDASSERVALSRARAIVLAGCQQGLVRPSDLRDALSRRGSCRHRGLTRESIGDAESGVDSLPERDFDRLCARAGLPAPSRQRIVVRPDARAYVDRAWEEFGIACEVHGIPHMAVARWDADLFRQNEIVIAGARLLISSSFAIRHTGDRVMDQSHTNVAPSWPARLTTPPPAPAHRNQPTFRQAHRARLVTTSEDRLRAPAAGRRLRQRSSGSIATERNSSAR